MNHIGLGAYGELLAERYLKKNGYKIIAKNCKFAGCELDIVCVLPKNVQIKIIKKRYKNNEIKTKSVYKYMIDSVSDTIVFVEVKYSSTRIFGEPMERIDEKKKHQIIKASQSFLIKNQISMPSRFDCISIVGEELTHIENAFDANL